MVIDKYIIYEINQAVDNIIEAVKVAAITMQEAFKGFQRIFNFIKVDNKEKQKYKPVLQIKPNKSVLTDKRLKNHYCRSNC